MQYNNETVELSLEVEELEPKLAPQSSSSFMDSPVLPSSNVVRV